MSLLPPPGVRTVAGGLAAALALFTAHWVAGQQPAAPAAAATATSASAEDFARAAQAFQDGQFEQALALFQKFEVTHKFSTALPEAIYYQGWCFLSLKRYAEAVAAFDRLIKSYPQSPLVAEASLRRADAYRELGNYDKALPLYREFQTAYPKHDLLPQAVMGEAWTLFRKKDYEAARATLARLRDIQTADESIRLDALLLLGQIFSEQQKHDEARQVYREIAAQRNNPRATAGLFLAGEAMFDAKRYNDAINYYKRVQSRAVMVANLQAERRALEAERARYIQEGMVSVYQSRLDALNQLINKFQQGEDLRPAALFRIANCHLALGRPEEASVVYRHFLQRYPDHKLAEQAHFGLIQALHERRQLAAAEQEKKEFEKKHPGSKLLTAADFMQAESQFGREQYADAIASYQKFLATSQDADLRETSEFRIASAYYGLKQFPAAIAAFTKFLTERPRSKLAPESLFRIGRAHFELYQQAIGTGNAPEAQKNLEAAVAAFERIRRDYPAAENLAEVTFQLGYLYGYLGAFTPDAYERAVAAFGEFLQKWPQHKDPTGKLLAPEAMYQMARSQVALGQTDAALASYNQLVTQFPLNELAPHAAFEIASVHASNKNTEQMIAALRAYVEKYPNHTRVGEALYAIGSEMEAQKKPDHAITEYRALINRALETPDLTEEFRNAAIAAQVRIAALLEQRNMALEAAADCERFLAKFHADPVAARAMISQLATLYRKARQIPLAYSKLEELAGQYQLNTVIRLAATTAALELALGERDYAKANAAALRLLADPEKDKLPPASLAAIGNFQLKTARFDDALRTFSRMQELYGEDPRSVAIIQLGLGQAQLGLNNHDAAEKAFLAMIAADPQHPGRADAELGLARIYLHRAAGKPATDPDNVKAVELLNRVMAGARGDTAAEASYRLGGFFFSQRDDPQKGKDNCKTALAYYLRASLLSSGEMGDEAAFRAGQCHECLGNPEAARLAYNSYLKRFPQGRFAAEARQRLAALPTSATPK